MLVSVPWEPFHDESYVQDKGKRGKSSSCTELALT